MTRREEEGGERGGVMWSWTRGEMDGVETGSLARGGVGKADGALGTGVSLGLLSLLSPLYVPLTSTLFSCLLSS